MSFRAVLRPRFIVPLLATGIFPLTANSACSKDTSSFENTFFSDDFSETTLRAAWGSWKSESTDNDGALVGVTPSEADHPSVNSLSRRILPISRSQSDTSSPDQTGSAVMFRDLPYKGSHAGHICHASISPTAVVLHDGKTGIAWKDIRDHRRAGAQLDEQTKEMPATRALRTPVSIDTAAWHTLLISIEADHLRAWIEDAPAGDLQAPGIALPTKSNMNITTVDREAWYDDFQICTR